MIESVSVSDAFRQGLGDSSNVVVSALTRADFGVHAWLGGIGLAPSTQNWVITALVVVTVVTMMNQFRYFLRGTLVLIASLTAMELVKPAILALGARLLFLG